MSNISNFIIEIKSVSKSTSKYQTILPKKEEFKKLLNSEKLIGKSDEPTI